MEPLQRFSTVMRCNVFLKIIAGSRRDCYERENSLPEEECGFSPRRSTADMMFVVRCLQELAREGGITLCMCFVALTRSLWLYRSHPISPSCEFPRRFGGWIIGF